MTASHCSCTACKQQHLPRGRVCSTPPRVTAFSPSSTNLRSLSFQIFSSSWLGAVPISPGWISLGNLTPALYQSQLQHNHDQTTLTRHLRQGGTLAQRSGACLLQGYLSGVITQCDNPSHAASECTKSEGTEHGAAVKEHQTAY